MRGQPGDPEAFQNFAHPRAALFFRQMREAVAGVFFHGEMREERQGLEDVGELPLLRRQIRARLGIEEQQIARGDAALVRARESGDTIQQRGLPRSGRPEKNREAGLDPQRDVQNEGARAPAALLAADTGDERSRAHRGLHGDHTRRFTAYTTDKEENDSRRRSRARRLAAP